MPQVQPHEGHALMRQFMRQSARSFPNLGHRQVARNLDTEDAIYKQMNPTVELIRGLRVPAGCPREAH